MHSSDDQARGEEGMKAQRVVLTVLVLGLWVVGTSVSHAVVDSTLSIGSSGKTEDKPQSKLWFNDGTWWAILPNGSDIYFRKLTNMTDGELEEQSFTDAMVDTDNGKRADVLWDGANLFVLMYKNSTTDLSLSKYSYSSGVYTRLQDFPISIPLQGLGAETATIAKDSTGKLWIAYESEIDSVPKITVIWSTSADHKTWDTTGKLLNTDAVDSDDIAAVVAFDNKIGVFWSNQNPESTDRFVFRVHVDSEEEESEDIWEDEEVVTTEDDIGDDHINFAVTENQDLLVATKSSVSGNEINLFIR
jgi:hypothetical protein